MFPAEECFQDTLALPWREQKLKKEFYLANPRVATWINFCCACADGISEPLPNYSLFLVCFVPNYRSHVNHFWANNFPTLKSRKSATPLLEKMLSAWTINQWGKTWAVIYSTALEFVRAMSRE